MCFERQLWEHLNQGLGPGHPPKAKTWLRKSITSKVLAPSFYHSKDLAPSLYHKQGVGSRHPSETKTWPRHPSQQRFGSGHPSSQGLGSGHPQTSVVTAPETYTHWKHKQLYHNKTRKMPHVGRSDRRHASFVSPHLGWRLLRISSSWMMPPSVQLILGDASFGSTHLGWLSVIVYRYRLSIHPVGL